MDILYLLIPLSTVLVLAIIVVFGWALHAGQFDDVEREGARILEEDADAVGDNQASGQGPGERTHPDSSR